MTRNWYTALKNKLDLFIRSEDLKFEEEVHVNQNMLVEDLR